MIVSYFLDFQLIGIFRSSTMYHETDHLESGHIARLESQKAHIV